MLQQKYRFHGHGSLRYLYKNGKTVREKSLSLRFVANERRRHSRCTVVVSRKVLKSAPKRNRVRRRLYELMRTHWQHINAVYDIAILVYDPHCYDMPTDELHEIFVQTLKKAHIWKD